MKRVQIEGKFAIGQLSMGTKICRPAGTTFYEGTISRHREKLLPGPRGLSEMQKLNLAGGRILNTSFRI